MRSVKIVKGNRVGESGLFHEFGRCDNGTEAETCAIIEHRDGTVGFYPVPYIQFVHERTTEQGFRGPTITENKILDKLKGICLHNDFTMNQKEGIEKARCYDVLHDMIIDAFGYLDKAGLL